MCVCVCIFVFVCVYVCVCVVKMVCICVQKCACMRVFFFLSLSLYLSPLSVCFACRYVYLCGCIFKCIVNVHVCLCVCRGGGGCVYEDRVCVCQIGRAHV